MNEYLFVVIIMTNPSVKSGNNPAFITPQYLENSDLETSDLETSDLETSEPLKND